MGVELPVVHCNKGSTVEISWQPPTKDSTMKHDLWSFSSEASYVSCAFDSVGAASLVAKSTTCGYTVDCDVPGTKFFACGVDGACENGLQRVRIIVTDSSQTTALKSQQPSLKTLAEVMATEMVPIVYTANALTDAKATSIEVQFNAIIENSPDSCADWLVSNDDATCKAFAYTDIGFVLRGKPTAAYALAEAAYDKALALKSNFCPALAYKTELYVNKNEKDAADTAFAVACTQCGTNSLDMSDVRLAYGRKKWTVPSGTACTAEVPARKNAAQLQKFKEDDLKEAEEEKKKRTAMEAAIEKKRLDDLMSTAPSSLLGGESGGDRREGVVGWTLVVAVAMVVAVNVRAR